MHQNGVYDVRQSLAPSQSSQLPTNSVHVASQILHLRVISGQQLPRPRGSTAKAECTTADPFVVVEVFGVPADCAEERTKTIRNDSESTCE